MAGSESTYVGFLMKEADSLICLVREGGEGLARGRYSEAASAAIGYLA
jgi:hypothetical protein